MSPPGPPGAGEQHSKDVKSLIACFHVIRDLSNRNHELERQVTELQARCTELVNENRRLKTGDV